MFKVLIVEDETPSQHLIAHLLQQVRPQSEIVAFCDSVQQTVDWLRQNPAPDLILMDIQLGDGLSFEILEQVPVQSWIIFITAYDHYTLSAFKANSLDYLLKPLKRNDLVQALEKWERLNTYYRDSLRQGMDWQEVMGGIQEQRTTFRKRFLIGDGEGWRPLEVSDILLFVSDHKVTFALTRSGQKRVIESSLERLEEELDPACFFRINRQHLIHRDLARKVSPLPGSRLQVRTPLEGELSTIPVSRARATAFKAWLNR